MGGKEASSSYLLHVSIVAVVEFLSVEFLCAKPLILTGALLPLTLGGISDF